MWARASDESLRVSLAALREPLPFRLDAETARRAVRLVVRDPNVATATLCALIMSIDDPAALSAFASNRRHDVRAELIGHAGLPEDVRTRLIAWARVNQAHAALFATRDVERARSRDERLDKLVAELRATPDPMRALLDRLAGVESTLVDDLIARLFSAEESVELARRAASHGVLPGTNHQLVEITVRVAASRIGALTSELAEILLSPGPSVGRVTVPRVDPAAWPALLARANRVQLDELIRTTRTDPDPARIWTSVREYLASVRDDCVDADLVLERLSPILEALRRGSAPLDEAVDLLTRSTSPPDRVVSAQRRVLISTVVENPSRVCPDTLRRHAAFLALTDPDLLWRWASGSVSGLPATPDAIEPVLDDIERQAVEHGAWSNAHDLWLHVMLGATNSHVTPDVPEWFLDSVIRRLGPAVLDQRPEAVFQVLRPRVAARLDALVAAHPSAVECLEALLGTWEGSLDTLEATVLTL